MVRETRSGRVRLAVGTEHMSDHTVRVLDEDEHRAAGDLFATTLHKSPSETERWNQATGVIQPGRVLGAFDDELIGTVRSIDTTLVVPGGTFVANAAVTGVGVRSDRTRQGVLRELMHTQLAQCAARGVVTANLHASEGAIYGRFGYGAATYARRYRVDRHRTRLRDDLPGSGRVDRISMATAESWFPAIDAALPAQRPGMLRRSSYNWAGLWHWLSRSEARVVTIVHHGAAGVDGFAAYDVQQRENRTELTVHDMHVGTVEAFVGMWRYLHRVDLVDEIVLPNRPVDEPASLLFTDPRGGGDTGSGDESWLRLVDVPAALRAAARGNQQPLILGVNDDVLPANTGKYRVTPQTVERTESPPDLWMDVSTLGMVYLGAWRPSVLAAFGRIGHADRSILGQADRMFACDRQPWCGTHF